MLTSSCQGATVDVFLNQVWINQSDIVLIGLRDYQVCAIDCLDASVWNQTVLTVVVHLLKSLIPGRQGWRHPEVQRWRGQEPQVLRRVPGVYQDHWHSGLCWRRPWRWYRVWRCRLWWQRQRWEGWHWRHLNLDLSPWNKTLHQLFFLWFYSQYCWQLEESISTVLCLLVLIINKQFSYQR